MKDLDFLERGKRQLVEKPFYSHNVMGLLDQYHMEEISFSYMVEELNRIAKDFYTKDLDIE